MIKEKKSKEKDDEAKSVSSNSLGMNWTQELNLWDYFFFFKCMILCTLLMRAFKQSVYRVYVRSD